MAGVYSYSAIRREGAASELKRMHVLEGKDEQAVEEYLLDRQIPSLSDIDLTLLKDYRGFIKGRMGDGKKALHYCVLLESVVLYYLMPYYEGLCQIIDDKYPLKTARPLKNKLKMFLMLMKVTKPEEITFDHRLSFEEYLNEIDFGATKAVLSVELSMGQMITDVQLALNGRLPVFLAHRTGGMVPTTLEVANRAKAVLEGLK